MGPWRVPVAENVMYYPYTQRQVQSMLLFYQGQACRGTSFAPRLREEATSYCRVRLRNPPFARLASTPVCTASRRTIMNNAGLKLLRIRAVLQRSAFTRLSFRECFCLGNPACNRVSEQRPVPDGSSGVWPKRDPDSLTWLKF